MSYDPLSSAMYSGINITQLRDETTQNITDISELNSQVTSNMSSIDALQSEIDANTSSIATNTTNIASIQTQTNTNTTNIASNTSSISSIQTQTNTNTSNITANTSSISTLNTQVASNTSSISTLNTQVAANTSAISSLSSNIVNGVFTTTLTNVSGFTSSPTTAKITYTKINNNVICHCYLNPINIGLLTSATCTIKLPINKATNFATVSDCPGMGSFNNNVAGITISSNVGTIDTITINVGGLSALVGVVNAIMTLTFQYSLS